MTFFETVRDAMLAGFGMQQKVKEFIEELVKKGELSESQAAKMIKEWTDRAGKGTEDLSRTISDMLSSGLEKMNIPTKEELEKLSKKVQQLSARVKKLEGGSEE